MSQATAPQLHPIAFGSCPDRPVSPMLDNCAATSATWRSGEKALLGLVRA